MQDSDDHAVLHRRKLLTGLGGAGAAFLAAIPLMTPRRSGAAAQATASPAATPGASWTPPPLPQPPPTPGGSQPPIVGTEVPAPPGAATPVAVASPAAVPTATVTMTPDFKFDPDTVTINKGETIRWKNEGRSPQTVTCDPARAADTSHAVLPAGAQPWDSGVVNSGRSFSHTFDVAGDYVYFSMPQEAAGMIGRITVKG